MVDNSNGLAGAIFRPFLADPARRYVTVRADGVRACMASCLAEPSAALGRRARHAGPVVVAHTAAPGTVHCRLVSPCVGCQSHPEGNDVEQRWSPTQAVLATSFIRTKITSCHSRS